METTVTSFDERAKEREKKRENGGGGGGDDDDDELDDEDDVEDEEDEEARLEEEINAAALQDSNQLIIGSIAERMGVSMNEAEDDEGGDGGGDGVQTQQPQPQQILSAGHLLNNIAIVSSQQQPKGQQQQQPLATPTSGKSTRTLLAPPVPPLQTQPPGTPSTVDDPRQITVTWRDLTYTVEGRTMTLRSLCASADDLEEAGEGRLTLVRHTKRTILKGVNGHFATGQLTAVMGPSGSGKSTMLECIVGFRKRGLTGDIRVASGGKNDQNSEKMIKMALISQSDYLIESFTVREMLVYASRLKNWRKEDEEEARLMKVVVEKDSDQAEGGKSSSKRNLLDDVEEGGGGGGGGKVVKNVHQKLALSVCAQLGLDVCIDTRAGSCSGGQKKRISIALEMISKPSILILDEPTSGLDSSACYQTVTVMQRLAKNERNPTAVVATIHQPSARVFALFDHVYVISYNGHCIYEGSPKEMLAHLTSVGLRCPQFHNPADYIAEVASGEYGPEALDKLIEVKQAQDTAVELAGLGVLPVGSSRSLAKYSESNAYPTMLHLWILLQRTTMHILRDPMLNSLRLLSHLLTALFIGLLYGPSIGKPSLCPPLTSPLNDLENFPAYRLKFQEETVTSTENLAFIFFTLMFVMFGSMMPTIMTFPENLTNIRKEKINGWYSIATYYVALSIAEIPFQVIYPVIFCIVAYLMTGQLLEPERLSYFLLIHVIMAFVSQSLGLLLGAIFMEDASAAVFLGPISTVPIMLFGGFFVRISTIPWYLRYFTYLSYLRYAFEASMVTVYGFSRCKLDPSYVPPDSNSTTKPEWMGYATMVLGEGGEKFVDSFARTLGGTYDPSGGKTYHSALLDQYNIDEKYFFVNIGALLVFFLILRIITYLVLVFKINKKD